MTDSPAQPFSAAPLPAAAPPVAPLFQGSWPAPAGAAPGRVPVAAAAAGLLAATVAVAPRPGLGLSLAGVGVVAALLPALRHRLDAADVLTTAAVVLLVLVPVRTDSEWLAAAALLAAAGVGAVVLTRARSWVSVLLAAPAAALAVVRAVPWAGRRVGESRLPAGARPLLRGVAVGLPPALLVGALFASADPVFSGLVSALVPELTLTDLPLRLVSLLLCAGLVLGGAYLLAAPPRWATVQPTARRGPSAEWLPAVVLIDLVTVAFLVVQGVALFGGHEVVTRGIGVTYAERAREGFGQLVVTTLITLAVLAWAARRCRPQDRRLLLGLGGVLVGSALLVVLSALNRLWLYEQAYGLTVTRLVAGVFEAWLGLVLVLVALAGLLARRAGHPSGQRAGHGGWVARAAVLAGAAMFAALALTGPDAVVAASHVERYERTGAVDIAYLSTLSADAVPALARLPEPYRSCVLAGRSTADQGWTSWNLARNRASAVLDGAPAAADDRWECYR